MSQAIRTYLRVPSSSAMQASKILSPSSYNSSTLLIKTEDGKNIPWTASGMKFTFNVDEIPANIIVRDCSAHPNVQYTTTVTAEDEANICTVEKGVVWSGYSQVTHVFLGTECVYSDRDLHKAWLTINVWGNSANVMINGETMELDYSSSATNPSTGSTETLYTYRYPDTTQNSSVLVGEHIIWYVEKEGYKSQHGELYLKNNTEIYCTLEQGDNMFYLEIVPTPSDSIVYFNNAHDSDRKRLVNFGETVSWKVDKQYYDSSYGSVVVTKDTSLFVELSQQTYTLTVVATPTNATVQIGSSYSTDLSNLITSTGSCSVNVPSGTYVYWTVWASGYDTTYSGTTVTSNQVVSVSLTKSKVYYTITFDPIKPEGATIETTVDNVTTTLIGNTTKILENTIISYTASADGYSTISGSLSVTSDTTIPINLTKEYYTFTISTPNDENGEITVTTKCASHSTYSTYSSAREIDGCEYGWVVEYTAKRTGYADITGSVVMYKDETVKIYLSDFAEIKSFALFKIYSSDNEYVNMWKESLMFICNDTAIQLKTSYETDSDGNKIKYWAAFYTGQCGKGLSYTAYGDHFYSYSGNETLPIDETKTKTIEITLTPKRYRVYFDFNHKLTESSSTNAYYRNVVLNTGIDDDSMPDLYEGVAKGTSEQYSVIVSYGHTLYWSVYSKYYKTYSGNIYVDGNKTVGATLYRKTVTVNLSVATPAAGGTIEILNSTSSGIVSIEGNKTSNVTVVIAQQCELEYLATATGYNSKYGSIRIQDCTDGSTISESVELTSSQTYTLTFNPEDPSTGMTIVYAIGDTNNFNASVTSTLNDYELTNIPYGKYVYWSASAPTYVQNIDSWGYIYMDGDKEQSVDLVRAPGLQFKCYYNNESVDASITITDPSTGFVFDGSTYWFTDPDLEGCNVYYTATYNNSTKTGSIYVWSDIVCDVKVNFDPPTYNLYIETDPYNCVIQVTTQKDGGKTTLNPDSDGNNYANYSGIKQDSIVDVSVSKPGWVTAKKTIKITEDTYLNNDDTIVLTCKNTTPFSITALYDGYIIPLSKKSLQSNNQLKYRIIPADASTETAYKNVSWENYIQFDLETNPSNPSIYVEKGQTVEFCQDFSGSNPWSNNDNAYEYFKLVDAYGSTDIAPFHVFGNIMSLIVSNSFDNSNATLNDYNFAHLFDSQPGVSSCRQLILKTGAQATGAYYKMFYNCTGLTDGRLVINNINNSSTSTDLKECRYTYGSMFEGCTLLSKAPVISVRYFKNNYSGGECFNKMFYGCASINEISSWFQEAPASSHTSEWLKDVSTNGTFHILSSASWNNNLTRGTNTVPLGWTISTDLS